MEDAWLTHRDPEGASDHGSDRCERGFAGISVHRALISPSVAHLNLIAAGEFERVSAEEILIPLEPERKPSGPQPSSESQHDTNHDGWDPYRTC